MERATTSSGPVMAAPDVQLKEDKKPIRFLLREATATLHARVDNYFGKLLRDRHCGYARFLTRTARSVLPLERALREAGVSRVVPDWPIRSRSAALLADLGMLSEPVPDAFPAYDDPLLDDEAYMFGVMYVLEGSRLGARVILGMLETNPVNDPRPTLYLSHGHGLPLWQTFIAQLESSEEVRRNPQITVAGASAAFRFFLHCDG